MADQTDRPDDEARSPVDQLVDYCVFAPIGFALEARTLLPTFVDRGRAQVGVAKMVGEFAVKWGSTKVEAVVVDAQDQAMAVLRRTGLAPLDERERSAGAATVPGPATPPPTDAPADDVVVDVDRGPAIDVETLAIPDYDNLSASQVVPRLDGLEPAELDAVGCYERAGRRRKTILNRVAQLQHPDE
jgi:hypothetical protein